MPANQTEQTKISQELVKITSDLNGLINKIISVEEKIPDANCNIEKTWLAISCKGCKKEVYAPFPSAWHDVEFTSYRGEEFCKDCYYKKAYLLADIPAYQALIKKNNEAFVAYQNDVRKQLGVVESRVNELETHLKKYETELEDKEKLLEEKNKEFKEAKEQAEKDKTKAEQDLTDAKKTLDEVNTDLEKVKLDFSEANKIIKELKGKGKARDDEINDKIFKAVQNAMKDRAGTSDELTQELTEAETKIIALELEKKVMMENHEVDIQHLNLQITNLNNQVTNLQHQLNGANNLLTNSQQQVQQKNDRITQLEATIQEGIQKFNESIERNKDLIKENDNLSAEKASLALVIIDKDKKIEEKDKEINTLNSNLTSITTERDNLKTTNDTLTSENNQLKEDLKTEVRQRKIALLGNLAQGVTDILPIPSSWKTGMKTSIQMGSTYALFKNLPSWSYEFLFMFIGIGLFLAIPRLFRKLFGWKKKSGEVSVVINNAKPTNSPKLAEK